jgi:hypothetical protein
MAPPSRAEAVVEAAEVEEAVVEAAAVEEAVEAACKACVEEASRPRISTAVGCNERKAAITTTSPA